MTTKIVDSKVLEQVIDALDTAHCCDKDNDNYYLNALTALRAALNAPQPEPGVWARLIRIRRMPNVDTHRCSKSRR